jgi:PKD repeat protein
MSAFGVVYFDTLTDRPDAPEVKVDGRVTETGVTLWHEAGDGLDESDLSVTLRVDGTEWTNVTWANGTVAGVDDGRFTEGETWTWDDGNFSTDDRVEVSLVHESSGTVVFRERHVPQATGDGGTGDGAGGGSPSPPTASFVATPSNPETGESVTFDASASDDPDGGSLTYQWDFGDGATGNGETVQHSFDDDGTNDVSLTVTDDEGSTATTTRTLTVANHPPTASFSFTPSSPGVGESVTFDAGTSSDPDGDITIYDWDFGDGAGGSGETVQHTYTSSGTYVVTLTVTDGDGSTDTTTRTVGSSDTTEPSVTVNSPNGGEVVRGGATYEVTWSASDDIAVDSVKLEYSTDGGNSWSIIDSDVTDDGSYDWTVPRLDATGALIRVTATDGAGNTGSDTSDSTFDIDGTRPDVDTLDVSSTEANPGGKNGEVIVDWAVSDGIALQDLSVRLERTNGQEVETQSPPVGGTSVSSITTFDKVDSGDYRVVVTVADGAGRDRQRSEPVTVQKSGGDNTGQPECTGPPSQRPPSCG